MLGLILALLFPLIADAEENGFGKLWSDLKTVFRPSNGEHREDPASSEEPPESTVVERAPESVTKPPPPRPSQRVALIQRNLDKLGYDPGPVDGFSGPQTRSAIRAYRKDHDLEQGVQIDDALMTSLRAEVVSEGAGTDGPRTVDRRPRRAQTEDSKSRTLYASAAR